ncbi:TrkH family potassium uptake protein [Priestia flexa]|uniref:TrkH family potassium uptake protein n=1 Tax=Priestia flexa TaxID=86664 RepID=UPI002287311B|nr:TrkH family potassium uptake protein [Priestia flexa]MED4587924.1 TrkH family potassium uptake protein [Priestia flexa]
MQKKGKLLCIIKKGMSIMRRNWKHRIRQMSSAQVIVGFYLTAVTVGFLLLSIPAALKPGVELDLINRLFIAVSAVSVTGLTPVSTAETFSTFGYFILAFIFQIGGIGVMTLSTFIWLLIGKKIGLKERQLIMMDHNQSKLSGLVNLMRNVLLLIFAIEAIGALVLTLHFHQYYLDWKEAFLHGFFSSISATTNAGFDITGASFVPYANDYFVQVVTVLLITLGAIGFPVLIEVKHFFLKRKEKRKFQFSLFAKLTSIMFLALLAVGTLLILLLEQNAFMAGKSWHEAFFYAFFQSAATRSGGVATMDVSEFTLPTLLIMSAMMFIGASPSSVGGGIRTTTFALNILFLFYYARGSKTIKIFRREIHEDDITKSVAVSMFAIIICSTSVIILTITESFSLTEIIFEVCSAFGTTGLSMGITSGLSDVGKILIIILMFIGRIGMLVFILMLRRPKTEPDYHYPKERIIIG